MRGKEEEKKKSDLIFPYFLFIVIVIIVFVILEFRNLVGNKHIKGQQKERLLTIMTMHPGFCVSFDECGKSTLEYLIEGNKFVYIDFCFCFYCWWLWW